MVLTTFTKLFSVVGLASVVSAASYRYSSCSNGNYKAYNPSCCAFYEIKDDLLTNFFNNGCSEEVHEVLRLTFHDAMGYSQALVDANQFGGTGADGSFLLFPDEENFKNNEGVSHSVDAIMPFYNKYNVSAGDFIQFAGAVGLTQCPGAPRLDFMAGRVNAAAAPPEGLTPSPVDTADVILARFADAGGFTPAEVVSLLAAHSVARANLVDPSIKDAPFDSTPFTFDSQFFLETLLQGTGYPGTSGNAAEVTSPLYMGSGDDIGEIRLFSDQQLASDSRTACTWQSYVADQALMASAFKAAMAKMSVIGQDTSSMYDCTEALPYVVSTYVKKAATYPATKSFADVQQSCLSDPFPSLTSDPGSTQSFIPHCPNGETTC